MLIVVVLPAPLLPSRAKTVPFWTLKLTSSRTETSLYDLRSDLASIALSMSFRPSSRSTPTISGHAPLWFERD